MATNIFRFLSFESFVGLVLRKELAFVTYDMWQDPYEGFVLRAMQTDDGRADVVAWLKANKPADMPPEVRVSVLQSFCKAVHLQSWTKCAESDALWRIYAHGGNAVRIETTVKKIQKIEGVTGFPVEYKSMNLVQELKRVFVGNDMRVHEAFSCKRHAFAHEMEYRLVSNIDGEYLPEPHAPAGAPHFNPFDRKEVWNELYNKGAITHEDLKHGLAKIDTAKRKNKNAKYISFAHIPDFIESVIVHPSAADWFVETVSRFCEINQIRFEGRSKLYTFDHR